MVASLVMEHGLKMQRLGALQHVDLPGPGIKSMSPALADRILTSGLLGKSELCFLNLRSD